jgi:hypothetical protein
MCDSSFPPLKLRTVGPIYLAETAREPMPYRIHPENNAPLPVDDPRPGARIRPELPAIKEVDTTEDAKLELQHLLKQGIPAYAVGWEAESPVMPGLFPPTGYSEGYGDGEDHGEGHGTGRGDGWKSGYGDANRR